MSLQFFLVASWKLIKRMDNSISHTIDFLYLGGIYALIGIIGAICACLFTFFAPKSKIEDDEI